MVLFAYTTGISAGTFTSISEASNQMRAFAGYLQNNLYMSTLNPINYTTILWVSILRNIQVSLAIWALGLYFPGIPFVFLIMCIKGFFPDLQLVFLYITMDLKD